MKFQLIILGLFNFLHTILRTSKSIGNNTMKKMLLATALTTYYRCAQQTFAVQNKPAAVAPETITHHFFVSGIGQKKTVDAAKICGGAENVVKTET